MARTENAFNENVWETDHENTDRKWMWDTCTSESDVVIGRFLVILRKVFTERRN